MRIRLSSASSWVVTRVFPGFGICFFALVLATALSSEDIGTGELIGCVACCIAWNAVVLYFAVKTKDVWVEKDRLLIKGRKKEDRVDLAEIVKVTGWPFGNYRPVWVTFSRPTAFGRSIIFCTGFHLFGIGRNDAADALQRMVAKARASQRTQPTGPGRDRPGG